MTVRHCPLLRCQLCPTARAIATPISPEIAKRAASAVIGGASATIIRAEVKAEDHIRAKASPMKTARISIFRGLLPAAQMLRTAPLEALVVSAA